MKKHSLIGLVKNKYKSVKFDKDQTPIILGDFIKFYYGPWEAKEENLKPMDGKVTKLYEKGVEIITDCGWVHAEWCRISRIYKVKTSGKLKQEKIFAVDGNSPIPLIDAAMTRIYQIINEQASLKDLSISDKIKNKPSMYSRKLDFSKDGNCISISVKTKDDMEAVVSGLKRKTTIKPNKNGKISSSTLKKIISEIGKLVHAETLGVMTL